MSEPNTPHDALFKWTFSQVVHARAEFRSILPTAVLERVDLETLELCPGEFVDAALAASYSDLLYQVQIADRPGFLYVLFEHQSSPDPVMPLRLLGYIVRILETHVRACRDAHAPLLPLPIVLPVVLHHGQRGWTRAARLEELFEPELMALEHVARLVPRFDFVLDDLSRLTDDALRKRALDQVSSLTLWALRDARSPERLLATVRVWVDAMRQLLLAPSGMAAFQVIFRYISLVAEQPVAEQVLKIVLSEAPIAEEAMTTLAEKWKAEGREQGRAEAQREAATLAERWKAEGREQGKAEGREQGKTEGREQGKTEGREQGKTEGREQGKTEGREQGKTEGREQACRDLLEQLLVLKFGPLDQDTSQRIARAPEHELAEWTKRVLSANSLEQVFAS